MLFRDHAFVCLAWPRPLVVGGALMAVGVAAGGPASFDTGSLVLFSGRWGPCGGSARWALHPSTEAAFRLGEGLRKSRYNYRAEDRRERPRILRIRLRKHRLG